MNKEYKSGFITIIGRPNVGKSTLINSLVGQKIAITSPKPQTTRDRITGIITTSECQMIFVDTPGLHKGRHQLGRNINATAVSSVKGIDVILMVVDGIKGRAEDHVLKIIENNPTPVILVINKIDRLKGKLPIDEVILSYMNVYPFADIIPISARETKHLEHLTTAILKYLPTGPMYYPGEEKTDQTDTKLMSEIIREKIIMLTEEEVPHSVYVTVEHLEINKHTNTIAVSAVIIVERTTQKQILIGKNGEKIKEIGTRARKEINELLDVKMHLSLWVKVQKDWRNNPNDLKRFGYDK